jgi:hypothetical protein
MEKEYPLEAYCEHDTCAPDQDSKTYDIGSRGQ